VHADRQATGAGIAIIANEGPLATFVELSICRDGERAGGDDESALQQCDNLRA
jgi:hypothetical protein